MEVVNINPVFNELDNPESLINHIEQFTNESITDHSKILSKLLQQITIFDFDEAANPHKTENFKLNTKHYTVLAIENIINIAEVNNWGLCKNHSYIYLYNGTYWNEIDKDSFQKFLGEAAEKMGVPKISAKYHKFRKDLYDQFLGTAHLEPNIISNNKVVINLANGTFEIEANKTKLREFERNDFLTYQLPFEYNTKAEAPTFIKYLNTVLPDIERQNLLAEYLGYLFIKNGCSGLKLEKALILFGTGQNGKSVFFEIVEALLGKTNTSNFSLQSLTNDNGYYRAKIGNKIVNYASEINGKLQSDIFKQLVSGEPVEARLPYGEPFTLNQYAKLIFNCNILPKEIEHTNGFFRRFLIIPFDVTIQDKDKDPELAKKIIENELSGVFNWVLDGLNRVLDQKGFSKCDAALNALETYKSESDSVQMFIKDNDYKKVSNDYNLIKELYILYKGYCIEDGYRAVNKSNFIKRLESHNIEIKRINVGNVAYITNR